MGIIDYVATLLNQGGIRAEAAWPAEIMVMSLTPLAALSIENANREECTVTVLVDIVCDLKAGAAVCQTRALDACDILENAGARCTQGKCSIDEGARLFIVPVHAVFYGIAHSQEWLPMAKCSVDMNQVPMEYLCDCAIERAVELAYPTLADAPWQFTLEEFFPFGVAEPLEALESFELTIVRNNAVETYQGCVVKRHRRVVEEKGIRQIREGVASGRTVRPI